MIEIIVSLRFFLLSFACSFRSASYCSSSFLTSSAFCC
nr:MAG TPA: hypothetical protein [Caudoviricetes sp.]